MWGITSWASLIDLSYDIKLKNMWWKYYIQKYNFATYVSDGKICIPRIRNQYLHDYHLIVLSFFWGGLSISFCKRQFCMICFMQVVILSQNFSQHLWVSVHRRQAYACVEGSQSHFLCHNVLYILTLFLYTHTCFLCGLFLKKMHIITLVACSMSMTN